MDNISYAATVYPKREIIGDVIKFHAVIKFAEGYTITKTLEAPNDREYNPYDDAMLIRAYPVLSTLLKNGDMVYFDGVVSEGLLYSLSVVNQYYNSVYNNDNRLYKKINISVKKEEPVLRRQFSGDAVIAYSGGIDASHLLLSQKEKLCGAQNVNIKTAIMFQGLEILSSDNEKYARKYAACKETLDFYGIELIKLNLLDEEQGYLRYKWNLCAGLYLFANTCNYTHALVGSGGEGLNNMWYASDEGTPLIVDYFSSPAMTVRLEGSELTRTEKCKLLATSDIIMKNLIVCFFTNYEKTFNCGYCPKCIRTALNFLAIGYPPHLYKILTKPSF